MELGLPSQSVRQGVALFLLDREETVAQSTEGTCPRHTANLWLSPQQSLVLPTPHPALVLLCPSVSGGRLELSRTSLQQQNGFLLLGRCGTSATGGAWQTGASPDSATSQLGTVGELLNLYISQCLRIRRD